MASLTQEAERVQATNEKLQTDAREKAVREVAVTTLHAEIGAFQAANDRLEADAQRHAKHTAALEEQVHNGHARIELLQRQLVLAHHAHDSHERRLAAASPGRGPQGGGDGEGGAGGGPGNTLDAATLASLASQPAAAQSRRQGKGHSARRKLPLLWNDIGSPPPMQPASEEASGETTLQQLDPTDLWGPQGPPARHPLLAASRLGSPHRGGAAGAYVTQRAVVLHDQVASEPIVIERLAPAEPRLARPFVPDACRSLRVRDNMEDLAAASATARAEEAHGVQLAKELQRQNDANSQVRDLTNHAHTRPFPWP